MIIRLQTFYKNLLKSIKVESKNLKLQEGFLYL